MRCGVAHMLERGLSRGWGAWAEMVAERVVFLRSVLRSGLRYLVKRNLALWVW